MTYSQQLSNIANENGGGLSVELTGKYTSVRHEQAKVSDKLTAGEAAKFISKTINQKVSAKELVAAYKLLKGHEPEWHHAGFYKCKSGSTMGRTFFFDDIDIESMIADWSKIPEKQAAIELEEKRKAETIIKGFYYSWDHDYSGKYGKKKNYKVLDVYEGNELIKPRNFVSLNNEEFEKAKSLAGKKYFGWDEPTYGEFI